MGTTSIRVDKETHARLVEMSKVSGNSLLATVRQAAEALRRQRFAEQVTAELTALRQDSEAWANYLAGADATSVDDGLG